MQVCLAHALDDFGGVAEQPVFAEVLVVEGRQHEHPGAAAGRRPRGEFRGFAQGAQPGAGHEVVRVGAGVEQMLEQLRFLRQRQRVRLARGAEHGEFHALAEQPVAEIGEALRVGFPVFIKGRGDGGQRPVQSGKAHGFGFPVFLRASTLQRIIGQMPAWIITSARLKM